MEPILTLDARGNVMFEVVRDYYKLSTPELRRAIQALYQTTIRALQDKGLVYLDFRSALVPQTKKHEAGFIFDTQCIESDWYPAEVAKTVLPLLDKRTTQSVLTGELIEDDQNYVLGLLKESLVLSRSFKFIDGSLLFCVYINNMSHSALTNMHAELTTHPAYVGYIPCTFSSRAKTYLSTTLVHKFLKNRHRVIMAHEDDVPNTENINMASYPFDKFGYEVFSIQSYLYDVFLRYKIDRPVYPGFECDTEIALNAVSDCVLPLDNFTILLEEAKLAYLNSNKAGKMKSAGITDLGRNEISELIKAKIKANYIYNLVYDEQHDVAKLNIILEVARDDGGYPSRLTAVLDYKATERILRVISLH